MDEETQLRMMEEAHNRLLAIAGEADAAVSVVSRPVRYLARLQPAQLHQQVRFGFVLSLCARC